MFVHTYGLSLSTVCGNQQLCDIFLKLIDNIKDDFQEVIKI